MYKFAGQVGRQSPGAGHPQKVGLGHNIDWQRGERGVRFRSELAFRLLETRWRRGCSVAGGQRGRARHFLARRSRRFRQRRSLAAVTARPHAHSRCGVRRLKPAPPRRGPRRHGSRDAMGSLWGRLIIGTWARAARRPSATASPSACTPVGRMRECLTMVRRLLAGETLAEQGQFFGFGDAGCAWASDPLPVPIVMGAIGPADVAPGGPHRRRRGARPRPAPRVRALGRSDRPRGSGPGPAAIRQPSRSAATWSSRWAVIASRRATRRG